MGLKEIKNLIEAFYEGKTTPCEEKAIIDYFKGEGVADELLEERLFFLQLDQADEIDVPNTLCSDLSTMIDNLSTKEDSKPKVISKKTKLTFTLWRGIAASIAILLVVGIYSYSGNIFTSIDEPRSAFARQKQLADAENAVILLSQNFNKGINQLNGVSNNFDKTNEILKNTFNRHN